MPPPPTVATYICTGYGQMAHWFFLHASFLAVLVTAGVAVLLVCCMECSHCSSRDKDDLFSRHEV